MRNTKAKIEIKELILSSSVALAHAEILIISNIAKRVRAYLDNGKF